MNKQEAQLVLSYGAKLDAWASVVSRQLGRDFPDFTSGFEANRKDEIAHARCLARLSEEEVDETPVMMIASSALTTDPIFNLLFLNIFERRTERQFRALARAFPQFRGDLRAIAADENRHVKFGMEVVKTLPKDEVLKRLPVIHDQLFLADSYWAPQHVDRFNKMNGACVHGLLLDFTKRA